MREQPITPFSVYQEVSTKNINISMFVNVIPEQSKSTCKKLIICIKESDPIARTCLHAPVSGRGGTSVILANDMQPVIMKSIDHFETFVS